MSNVYKVKGFTDVIGGEMNMRGPVKDGSRVCAVVPPGCWGPMITPSIKSGHEVTEPVFVEGAEVGDSIAILVEKIDVRSNYATSGTSRRIEGRYEIDPTVNAVCPECKRKNPKTCINGIGEGAIRCCECGSSVLPQTMSNGYTLAFDSERSMGVSINKDAADKVASRVAEGLEAAPEGSRQHLATILGKADIEGLITRVKPMVGNVGCIPQKPLPSSRNGGDMLKSLNSTGLYGKIGKEDITDAHMDVNSVCEGSIVICPVKVRGGGVYFGDVHSIQGNGEMAGHTTDISAEVLIKVNVIKNLKIDGPIIIPPVQEIDYRFRPFSDIEYNKARAILEGNGMELKERLYPVQFVGSGDNLNDAVENALDRIVNVTGMDRNEVKNRVTVTGEVEIGRTSGLVYITTMLPESMLNNMKLLGFVKKQYEV